MEMIHHDFGFFTNGMRIGFHIFAQLFLSLLGVKKRISFYSLHQSVEAFDRRIVLQHIKNKAFLDGLLHGVTMERMMLDLPVRLRIRITENLQRLVFGSSRECKVTGIAQHFVAFHQRVDFIFRALFFVGFRYIRGKRHIHLGRCSASLAGVRFVDNDGKLVLPVFIAHIRQNDRKLLHGCNDDFLPFVNESAQIARALRMADHIAHLSKGFDRIPDLFVQNPAIRNDNDGIENRFSFLFQPNKLMCQPCNGIGLAAPRRMLDQVSLPGACLLDVGEELAYHR